MGGYYMTMEPSDGLSLTSDDAVPGQRKPPHRFGKGNKFGKGNPYARMQADFRRQWLSCVNELKIQAAEKALFDRMIAGDMYAARLWLEYGLGKIRDSAQVEDDEEAESLVIEPPEAISA